MQIHELNNFSGELNSGAYLAVDNGSDTGKTSAASLTAAVESEVSNLDDYLNGRIDNIIAGGTAPSAAEVTDARYGANGVTYPSLGDAIRSQVSSLQEEIGYLAESALCADFMLEQGAASTQGGNTYEENKVESTTGVRSDRLLPLDPDKEYVIMADYSKHRVGVGYYNVGKVCYDGLSWQTAAFTITDTYYISLAVSNLDGTSDITPTDVTALYIVEKKAIFNLLEAVKENTSNIAALDDIVSKVATAQPVKPNFISGVYQWDKDNSEMLWSANVKRATADLRYLGLQQGDSIGITDYDTYSIAFGDNGGWYDGGYATADITANNASILPYIILVKRNDNADMTGNDFEALKEQFHSSKEVTSVVATEEFAQSIGSALDLVKRANNNYIHLSFDDVGYCILNLVNNGASFNSLWDEPFFALLKRLHDDYGAIFSLYVWDVANIANMPDTFKDEFNEASTWLKFGFHATTEGSLETATAAQAKAGYDTFINNIFAKCGGVNSIDRIPRLNYFAGNLAALQALRDTDCGCIGFLSADDDRSAYYLNQNQLGYLRTHSLLSDRTNGLQFISTVMRLGWFVSGFSSQYNYNVPVENNPYDELVYRYGQPAMADLYSALIVFTHEWQIYSSSYVLNSAMVNRLEQVCQFAKDYNYDFDYPQNRIENITSYVI